MEFSDRSLFIDHARISVRGGRGGNGAASFRREKYVERGGPDGGNGGRGGDVVFLADPQMKSLLDLTYKPHFVAQDGSPGSGSNKTGHGGKDFLIRVPVGTVIYKASDDAAIKRTVIVDMRLPGQTFLAAAGGRGGRGNSAFKTRMTTAPRISERGEPGQEFEYDLELKLLADVGLIGFPNAGKSTLLSRLTHARPKIAAYPFTTLNPNLGVADWHHTRLIFADIPGLIEGAHAGKGLGHGFLRHIERTRILFHLVDVFGTDGHPAHEAIKIINEELRLYSPKLMKKPMVILANKMDLTGSDKMLAELKKHFKKIKIIPISAATGDGVDDVLKVAAREKAKPEPVEVVEEPSEPVRFVIELDFEVEKEKDIFRVKGAKVERLAAMTHFGQQEGVRRFQNILKKMGVEKELERQGAVPGDTVKIGKTEFFYEP